MYSELKAIFNNFIILGQDFDDIYKRYNEGKNKLLYYAQKTNEKYRRNRKSALIVVDLQNDFINGSLRVDKCPAKQETIPLIATTNRLSLLPFSLVAFSRDWHPSNHISFHESLHHWDLHESNDIQDKSKINLYSTARLVTSTGEVVAQKLWNRHCVEHTHGASFPEGLIIKDEHHIIDKGTEPDVDSYSAFGLASHRTKTGLRDLLLKHQVDVLFICGIATDVCVYHTCLDALELGYKVVLIIDACAGIANEDIQLSLESLKKKHVVVATTNEVEDLLNPKNLPAEFIIHDILQCYK